MPEPRPLHPLLPRAPHGGSDGGAFRGADFSVNSNPFGPNPRLVEAACQADHASYPDPSLRAARSALAAHHGASLDEVVPAAGASELLHRLARAYLNPERLALSLGAPFGEFARAVALQRAPLRVVPLDVTVEGLRRELFVSRPTLVYLSRPHNPTGFVVEEGTLRALADACSELGSLLILDAAYAPLDPGLAEFAGHPNLARLYSPGKAHGVVGLRPAYLLAPAGVAEVLHNLAPAWPLPAALVAVLEALPDAGDFVSRTVPEWRAEAARLAGALGELAPLEFSGLPFFTLEVGDAARVSAELLARGCRVRDCGSYGLPSRVRVSARLSGENDRLVQALREVLGG